MTEPHHLVIAGRVSGVAAPPSDSKRAYYRTDKAYYADAAALAQRGHGCFAEIMVSQLSQDGDGTHGEYAIRFGHFNTPPASAWMRLEVFQDGLPMLVNHADFLIALTALVSTQSIPGYTASYCPSPEEVEALLQSLGYHDATRYTRNT